MRVRVLIAILLLMPSAAAADPITVGSWSTVSSFASVDADGTPFWDGASWDGTNMGVGYLLDAYEYEGLEFLHDGSGNAVAFQFDGPISDPALLFNVTAWTGGTLGFGPDGVFTYDSGTGRLSNSWDSFEQYALFRLVGPETTRYFLGIEDILLSEVTDADYNDYDVSFTQPTPVPEPSTLLLLGTGAAGLLGRRLRTRWRQRRDAGN